MTKEICQWNGKGEGGEKDCSGPVSYTHLKPRSRTEFPIILSTCCLREPNGGAISRLPQRLIISAGRPKMCIRDRVYVSIYDTPERVDSTMEALERAEGFIRAKLNDKIKVRRIPNLALSLIHI